MKAIIVAIVATVGAQLVLEVVKAKKPDWFGKTAITY